MKVVRLYNDGTEAEMEATAAEAELVGEIIDDISNKRWGSMRTEDGDEVTAVISVTLKKHYREVTHHA